MRNSVLENRIVDLLEQKPISTVLDNNLTSSIKYFGIKNITSTLEMFTFNEELYDKNVSEIIYKLAKAIDKNSVSEVKYLKKIYGNNKDFILAKKYLNEQCKKVWSVFDDNKCKNIPKEALKALGITNCPDLEFLLGNSLQFLEDKNTFATVNLIKSILKNKNMNYDKNDILQYLINKNRKEKCHYNIKTYCYILELVDYTKAKMFDFGAKDKDLKEVYRNLDFTTKIKYLFKTLTRS